MMSIDILCLGLDAPDTPRYTHTLHITSPAPSWAADVCSRCGFHPTNTAASSPRPPDIQYDCHCSLRRIAEILPVEAQEVPSRPPIHRKRPQPCISTSTSAVCTAMCYASPNHESLCVPITPGDNSGYRGMLRFKCNTFVHRLPRVARSFFFPQPCAHSSLRYGSMSPGSSPLRRVDHHSNLSFAAITIRRPQYPHRLPGYSCSICKRSRTISDVPGGIRLGKSTLICGSSLANCRSTLSLSDGDDTPGLPSVLWPPSTGLLTLDTSHCTIFRRSVRTRVTSWSSAAWSPQSATSGSVHGLGEDIISPSLWNLVSSRTSNGSSVNWLPAIFNNSKLTSSRIPGGMDVRLLFRSDNMRRFRSSRTGVGNRVKRLFARYTRNCGSRSVPMSSIPGTISSCLASVWSEVTSSGRVVRDIDLETVSR